MKAAKKNGRLTKARDWRRLDPEKIRGAVAIVARSLGKEVTTVRNLATSEELELALAPYVELARLTATCGAFGYPVTKCPKLEQILLITFDFLRSVGESTLTDDIKLRSALARIAR